MTPSEVIAKRLKQARQELGLSQFELGVKTGIDEATAKSRISHYETAVNVPTLATFQKLAAALDKPLGWFYCDEDELEILASLHSKTKAERKKCIAEIKQILVKK